MGLFDQLIFTALDNAEAHGCDKFIRLPADVIADALRAVGGLAAAEPEKIEIVVAQWKRDRLIEDAGSHSLVS